MIRRAFIAGLFWLLILGESRTEPSSVFKARLSSTSNQENRKKTPDALKSTIYDPEEPCPGSRKLTEEKSLGDYVVRTYRDPNPFGCAEIYKSGRRLWSQTSQQFFIGGFDEKTRLPIGADVNNDGEPDLVIAEWTGGAHCCFKFHLFQIGKTFRKIDTIDAGDSDIDAFVDLDGDSMLEFRATDWTFAYWHTAFAFSPAVEVLLKYQEGRYRFAAGLMQSKAPSPAELRERAAQTRTLYARKEQIYEWWQLLWSEVLKLIYSGNVSPAREYIELAWPQERNDKAEVINDFKKTLSKSPYYRDILAINGGQSF